MTAWATVDQAARDAFRGLQARAEGEHGGNTQPLLVVYAVESFLRRLSMSEHASRMVLKVDNVRAVVAGICALEPDPHDGIVVDPATIGTEVMRGADE